MNPRTKAPKNLSTVSDKEITAIIDRRHDPINLINSLALN